MSFNELQKRICKSPKETGMYLELFHGRKDSQENLPHWGEQGPFFGPLESCHITFNSTIALKFTDGYESGPLMTPEDGLCIVGDMILFEGIYYGDWVVVQVEGKKHG